jgi:hypothetical protein
MGVGITSDYHPEVVDTYRKGGRRAGHIDGGVLPVRSRRRCGAGMTASAARQAKVIRRT